MDNQNEIIILLKRQLRLLSVILAVVVLCAVVLGIQSLRMWKLMSAVNAESLSNAVVSLEKTTSELEKLDLQSVNESVKAFASMAERMGQLDVESLNESFKAMATAIDNLQKLDADHLNNLIESLQKTAGTFDRFAGFFK